MPAETHGEDTGPTPVETADPGRHRASVRWSRWVVAAAALAAASALALGLFTHVLPSSEDQGPPSGTAKVQEPPE